MNKLKPLVLTIFIVLSQNVAAIECKGLIDRLEIDRVEGVSVKLQFMSIPFPICKPSEDASCTQKLTTLMEARLLSKPIYILTDGGGCLTENKTTALKIGFVDQ